MIKCSECKKNVAVLYVQDSKDKSKLRGLCLSCAQKLDIPGFDEILEKTGIDEDQIDNITEQMNSSVEFMEKQMQNMDASKFQEALKDISKNQNISQISEKIKSMLNLKDGDLSPQSELGGFLHKNLQKENEQDNIEEVEFESFDEDEKSEEKEKKDDQDDSLIDIETLEKEFEKLFGPLKKNGNIFEINIGDQSQLSMDDFTDTAGFSPSGNKKRERKKSRKTLDKYGTNLTDLAKENKIDPVIGREKEIQRAIQILNRRTKNNPVLIGEPGVGKTAIAEGLAYKIVHGDVPQKLLDYEVIQIDMASMVAGTQFRGQFETRLNNVIKEAKENGRIILVIDELHSIMGAGDTHEGNLDAANILKPALAKGDIQVLGATTIDEYKKTIEKDRALERRFQNIIVEEPTVEESIEIIKGLRPYYEEYHKISISDEVIESAVKLSQRYITDRYLPDKAIDVIDEVGSKLNLKNDTIHEIEAVKETIETVMQKQMEAASKEDYETVANNKMKQAKLEQELEELKQKEYVEAKVSDIANVIEQWTKIPVKEITLEESKKLMALESELKKTVVGQDEAIDVISKAIRRNRAGISPVKKPSSFIFVGPTGVGKTQLVKSLAKELFGSEDMIIRLDMSEYMEKHSVAKLIGSPPGYVGFEEGGQLTDKVKRKPYSIILLDEIEKAHTDVFNMLLQILDEGRLTDSQGSVVHFENTIIVMTSNIGTSFKNKSLGFGISEDVMEKDRVEDALKETFKPEFLNRVDETVIFNRLTRKDQRKIVDIMIGQLQDILKEKGIKINISETVKDFILEKGYDEKYGARPLRRTIQKYIEDEIADMIIQEDISKLNNLSLDMLNKKIKIDRV